MYASMVSISCGTLVNTPRRSCSAVMSRKKRSTIFSHDAEVGVECIVMRGYLASQS